MSDYSIVHVVDDDEALREAVAGLLRAVGFEVRAHASGGDFLMALDADTPGCVVLDVRMPGPSGLDLHAALARRPDAIPVVFLTGHGDIPMSVRAMKAGAADFLTKPVEADVLVAAVRSALARDADQHEARTRLRNLRERFDSLSPREHQVFGGVVAGRLNKQICADLGTSERTVKSQRAQVMAKMGAKTMADLVQIADELQAGIPELALTGVGRRRAPPGG